MGGTVGNCSRRVPLLEPFAGGPGGRAAARRTVRPPETKSMTEDRGMDWKEWLYGSTTSDKLAAQIVASEAALQKAIAEGEAIRGRRERTILEGSERDRAAL